MMSDEITVNKTTALLVAGLFLAVVIGGYAILGGDQQAQVQAPAAQNSPQAGQAQPPDTQEVYLKATAGGYDKSEIVVRKGFPVRLHFTAINAGCGSQLVIYGMGVNVLSKNGQEAVVEFTPDKEGTFEYNCGMKMMDPGRFVVTA